MEENTISLQEIAYALKKKMETNCTNNYICYLSFSNIKFFLYKTTI